jgi:outer membrane immunogenic protein
MFSTVTAAPPTRDEKALRPDDVYERGRLTVIKQASGAIVLSVLTFMGMANAADLPIRGAYKAPPPIFSWTGIYIGLHAGAALGLHEDTFTTATLRSVNQHYSTGFLGGGQVGVNYQTGPWVIGAEAQLSWSGLDGTSTCEPGAPVALINCRTQTDWLGTVAARFGIAFDRTMIFVKAGGAWAHDKHEMISFIAPFVTLRTDETRYGWMFGTGVEHAVFGNWSAKVEYDYLDFGTRGLLFPGLSALVTGLNENVPIRQHIHLVKFGVNYRFGADPVIAKY